MFIVLFIYLFKIYVLNFRKVWLEMSHEVLSRNWEELTFYHDHALSHYDNSEDVRF